MPKLLSFNKFIGILFYSIIALSFLYVGQDNSFSSLIKTFSFYSDLVFSFTATFLAVLYIKWYNKRLFNQYEFLSHWKIVVMRQLVFAILIPSFVAMILEIVYLKSIGISFWNSSILNLELPLSLLLLTLIILVYDFWYLFQLKQIDNQKEDFQEQETITKKLDFIFVQFGANEKKVSIDDCAYIFTCEKIIWLQTFSNTRYRLQGSLDEWEAKLEDNHFYRINRQFLTSSIAIKSVEQTETRRLKVRFNIDFSEDVFISKPNISKFRKWWNQECPV